MRIKKNPKWSEEQHKKFDKLVQDNDGYCPCSLVKSDDTRCVCKEFVENDDQKICHCKRYIKII